MRGPILTTPGESVFVVVTRHGDTLKNKEERHGTGLPLRYEQHTPLGVSQMENAGKGIGAFMIAACAGPPEQYQHIELAFPHTPRCQEAGMLIARTINSIAIPSAQDDSSTLKASLRMDPDLHGIRLSETLAGASNREMAARNKTFRDKLTAWQMGWESRPPTTADGEQLHVFMWRILVALHNAIMMRRSNVIGFVLSTSGITAMDSWLSHTEYDDVADDGLPVVIPYVDMQPGEYRIYHLSDEPPVLTVGGLPPEL